MKVTIVSDLHLDAKTGGFYRHGDIERALFEAADKANRESQLFICTGDVCDPDSGAVVFKCLATLTSLVSRLKIPSVFIAGNHDVCETGDGTTTLEPLKSLTTVIDRPGLFEVNGIEMLALPFTPFSHRYDPKKIISEADGNPRLSLSHLNVKGAQPGDEEDMIRGREVWLPTKDIIAKFPKAVMVNGHIHRRQITEDGVHIPGSLERLRFDEERHNPGWLELEIG